MKLDFGRVKTYRAAGFGFVTGFLSNEIFFRIEKITDKDVQNALKANEDCKSLSENVCFWYAIEKTDKGNRVKKVYRNVQDIPDDVLFAFIDELHKPIGRIATSCTYYTRNDSPHSSHYSLLRKKLNSQLFANAEIPNDKLQKIIAIFKTNLELPKLGLPDWCNEVTCKLFTGKEYTALILERQETLKEYLVKSWKDKTSLLTEYDREWTLRAFGEKQYNLLLAERLYSRFIVQDRIATDKYTDLTWCRYTLRDGIYPKPKGFKEEEVIQAVEQFNKYVGEGGFTDWRLPTIGELEILTKLRKLEFIESGIEVIDFRNEEWTYLDKRIFPDAAIYVSGLDRYSPQNPNIYYVSSAWGNSGAVYYYGSDWCTGDGRTKKSSIRLVRGEPLFDMKKVDGWLNSIKSLEDWQRLAQENEEIAKINPLN